MRNTKGWAVAATVAILVLGWCAAGRASVLAENLVPINMKVSPIMLCALNTNTANFCQQAGVYRIFYDPKSLVEQTKYTAYITGPAVTPYNTTKLGLFFRSITGASTTDMSKGTKLPWRIAMAGGCVNVGQQFLCSFRAPKDLIEKAIISGQAVEVMVAKLDPAKVYECKDAGCPMTGSNPYELKDQSLLGNDTDASLHSPIMRVGDLNGDGTPDAEPTNCDLAVMGWKCGQ